MGQGSRLNLMSKPLQKAFRFRSTIRPIPKILCKKKHGSWDAVMILEHLWLQTQVLNSDDSGGTLLHRIHELLFRKQLGKAKASWLGMQMHVRNLPPLPMKPRRGIRRVWLSWRTFSARNRGAVALSFLSAIPLRIRSLDSKLCRRLRFQDAFSSNMSFCFGWWNSDYVDWDW